MTCEKEFDTQCKLLRKELKLMLKSRDAHVQNLKQWVDAETEFYEKSSLAMKELKQELHQ